MWRQEAREGGTEGQETDRTSGGAATFASCCRTLNKETSTKAFKWGGSRGDVLGMIIKGWEVHFVIRTVTKPNSLRQWDGRICVSLPDTHRDTPVPEIPSQCPLCPAVEDYLDGRLRSPLPGNIRLGAFEGSGGEQTNDKNTSDVLNRPTRNIEFARA